ncbi:MAG: outer membrane lipoprotein-sorting protein [Paracoccaceae bacterium]|jgi:outer membrane lipoprotein-sorting protein
MKALRPKRSLLTALIFTVSALSFAQDQNLAVEEKGLAIAREADRRDAGWRDSTATMMMVLRDRQGQESTRKMRSKGLEVADDGDKNLIVFDVPRDIRGTALLTFSHKTGDDDQWLYLPALKVVKRIASSNKSGPFMASEFSYEDISSQDVEKYSYKFLRDEMLNGLNCFVIERVPVNQDSGYSRQHVWLDKAEYRVQKVDYYDRKQSHLKTLTFHDYQQYLNKHWRAARLEMTNHQTKKSTTLGFQNYQIGTGMDHRDFNQSGLARMR